MKHMIGKLLCWLWGHKRGKRDNSFVFAIEHNEQGYRCPRCGATWTRKARKAT